MTGRLPVFSLTCWLVVLEELCIVGVAELLEFVLGFVPLLLDDAKVALLFGAIVALLFGAIVALDDKFKLADEVAVALLVALSESLETTISSPAPAFATEEELSSLTSPNGLAGLYKSEVESEQLASMASERLEMQLIDKIFLFMCISPIHQLFLKVYKAEIRLNGRKVFFKVRCLF
jgi:hypothetical protein